MSVPRRFAAAIFVAFLFYACQIGAMFQESARYHRQWDAGDAMAVLLGIVVLACTAVGLDALVRRSKSAVLRHFFNHAFLVAVASGTLAVFGAVVASQSVVELLWLAAMAGIGFSFGRPQWSIDLRTAKICSLFSPVVALAVVPMAFWNTWPDRPESLPSIMQAAEKAAAHPSVAKRTPVVFIVFDMWSFPRSSENGQFRQSFKNLRQLAEKSVTFTEAISAGYETDQSLSRMIFQTDKTFTYAGGKTVFNNEDDNEPTQQMPSLFQLAGNHGYITYILGFYHSYRQMLGDQADYCHVFPCYRSDSGLGNKLVHAFARNAVRLNDPLSLRMGWFNKVASRHWFDVGTAYWAEVLDILATYPENGFAMFHVPCPHAPFVFNPDGTYHGEVWNSSSAEDYQRQLARVDVMVGEVVATLRDAGKFDDALLVITSDHSWGSEPEPLFNTLPDFKRRVPLVIKLPGQKSGCTSNREISPNQLKPLFEAVFAGEKDPRVLRRLLGINGDAGTVPPSEA